MEQYKGSGKVDPDYESYNSAVELNEEEDKNENLVKLRKIIEEAYNKEIIQRQEQIEQIEMQICKVRKLLHLLRYVLVMSYYKKKELEYNGTEDQASTADSLVIPDKQNRIHPAIKKLLGKNVNNLDHLNIRSKRKSIRRHNNTLQPQPNLPEMKKIKLDPDATEVSEKLTTHMPHKNENNLEFARSRKKTKYRIVVGNISKWVPSSEDEVLTHKWLVYVRGPKEKPDVSHFIHKVVYYLHPSYKPHDVVEVSESPFHLARRGWGEFPVRVQIFFKVKLNKPIDVVHNIKLDKTYSGRQTLGNETIIDVFLYEDNEYESEITSDRVFFHEQEIKIEDVDLESELYNVEHDYCTEIKEEKTESDALECDHSYCLPSSEEGMPKPVKEKVEQDENNTLIYGLDTYCHDTEENGRRANKTIIGANTFKQLIQLNRKDIKFSNTKIIVFGKKVEGSFLSNFNRLLQAPRDTTATNKMEVNSLRVTLPKNRFRSMGEALPYLFKRLPLYSDLANNVMYKRMYPFTASTLKEFVSWNVGKRRSSEWSRARVIRNILSAEKAQGIEKWSTKSILMYGRSHDYTPFISYGLFARDSEEKNLLLSCYSDSRSVRNSVRILPEDDADVDINVDSDTDVTSPKTSRTVVDISDPHLKMECSYIRQTALDCGIILKPEEIIEGVKVNGAEVMILEAVKCLAENLIRRAKNHRVCTRTTSSTTIDSINKDDVEMAINERPETFCIRQFRNERRNADYFS